MREKFNKQLAQLYTEVKEMGMACEKAVETASKTVVEPLDSEEVQKELLDQVEQYENEINHKEHVIEGLCIRLLLHEQPVASDFRTVSAAHKMISDMERIGDQAYDIAELSKYISKCGYDSRLHLKELFTEVIAIVKKSVDSFIKNDLDTAISAIRDDDKVDFLFDKVKTELINMIKNDCDAELCIDLIMVAKYLERIGDHAVNIAEWVEYSITSNLEDSE